MIYTYSKEYVERLEAVYEAAQSVAINYYEDFAEFRDLRHALDAVDAISNQKGCANENIF